MPVTAMPYTAQKFINQYVTRPPTNLQQQKQPKKQHGYLISITVTPTPLLTHAVDAGTKLPIIITLIAMSVVYGPSRVYI